MLWFASVSRETTNKGIFAEMLIGLAADHGEEKTVMTDVTYLKAHRTRSARHLLVMSPDPSQKKEPVQHVSSAALNVM